MENRLISGVLELFFTFCNPNNENTYRLCGFPPFYAESNEELFDQIKKGKYDFPSPHWDQISDMAKDLIQKILIVDPALRLGADGILAHTWVVGEKTPRKQLPNVTSKIREFNAKRRFRVVFMHDLRQKLAMVAIAAKKIELLVKERKEKLGKK